MGINGDIEAFYQNLFWQNWQEDVKQLDGNHMIVFTPELSEDKTTEINQREDAKLILKRITMQVSPNKINLLKLIQSHNQLLTN